MWKLYTNKLQRDEYNYIIIQNEKNTEKPAANFILHFIKFNIHNTKNIREKFNRKSYANISYI